MCDISYIIALLNNVFKCIICSIFGFSFSSFFVTTRRRQQSIHYPMWLSRFHSVPRFGHSNDASQVASIDPVDQEDYVRGILSFGVFLFVVCFMWLVVLLILKCVGSEKIGCAAGGDEIEVGYLNSIAPKKARSFIRRSRRIKNVFFACSTLLPVMSFLFLYKGVAPVVDSISDVQSLSTNIQEVSHQAIALSLVAMEEGRYLREMDGFEDLYYLEETCPDNMNGALKLNELAIDVRSNLVNLLSFLNTQVPPAVGNFQKLISASELADEVAETTMKSDWIVKSFILILNVTNGALLLGLIFSTCYSNKNNKKGCVNQSYYPYKSLLIFLVVPSFCILLFLSIAATTGFAVTAVASADFCVDGVTGTIEQMIGQRSSSQEDLAYRALQYYSDNCETEYPFASIAQQSTNIKNVINKTNVFLEEVANIGSTAQICGDQDSGPLIEALHRMIFRLEPIVNLVDRSIELSQCSNVSPIMQEILHGAPCDSSTLGGMAWMFWCMLAITTCCLIMLTLRAALYNAITSSGHDTKSAKSSETKWDDYYDDYMQEYSYKDRGVYYEDEEELSSKMKDPALCPATSFETELTREPSEGAFVYEDIMSDASEVTTDYSFLRDYAKGIDSVVSEDLIREAMSVGISASDVSTLDQDEYTLEELIREAKAKLAP